MSSKIHTNHGTIKTVKQPPNTPKQKHISVIRKLVTIFNAANLNNRIGPIVISRNSFNSVFFFSPEFLLLMSIVHHHRALALIRINNVNYMQLINLILIFENLTTINMITSKKILVLSLNTNCSFFRGVIEGSQSRFWSKLFFHF